MMPMGREVDVQQPRAKRVDVIERQWLTCSGVRVAVRSTLSPGRGLYQARVLTSGVRELIGPPLTVITSPPTLHGF